MWVFQVLNRYLLSMAHAKCLTPKPSRIWSVPRTRTLVGPSQSPTRPSNRSNSPGRSVCSSRILAKSTYPLAVFARSCIALTSRPTLALRSLTCSLKSMSFMSSSISGATIQLPWPLTAAEPAVRIVDPGDVVVSDDVLSRGRLEHRTGGAVEHAHGTREAAGAQDDGGEEPEAQRRLARGTGETHVEAPPFQHVGGDRPHLAAVGAVEAVAGDTLEQERPRSCSRRIRAGLGPAPETDLPPRPRTATARHA